MDQSDLQLEYRAISSGAGMRLLRDRLFVRVSGDDRVSFMHGMCSANVKNLAPGEIARALFLTEHAHVIADVLIYVLEEPALWLETERRRWPALRGHLERLLVADDVEFEELDALVALDLEGSAPLDLVGEFFGRDARELKEWHHLAHGSLRIANLPRYSRTAFTIIGAETDIGSEAERLRHIRPEMLELHAETLETLRIESGLALVGTDTTERTLALEARLEPAIAFNKGCYLGQETIERATAHGALKRRLCGLCIAGNEAPPRGAVITLQGKEVGHLSSVAQSPVAGLIGLAILHHSAWPAGTHVSIIGESGTFNAEVCGLPFAPARSVDVGEVHS